MKNNFQNKVDNFYYLYNSLNDAVFVLDLDGYFLEVNDTVHYKLGYTKQELFSMHINDVDVLYEDNDVKDKVRQILEKGQMTFESVHITRNGKKIPVEINSATINFNGKPALISIARDITERKRTYEKLKRAEEEKNLILNSTSEQITYQNLNYKIIWCNKAVSDFLGLDYTDIVGQCCYKLWIGTNIKTPCKNCPVKSCIETGKHEENDMGSPDCRIWNVRADPVRDSEGCMVGVIKIANEITENVKTDKKVKKYARELRKINIELEERVQEQTEQIKNAERTRELELHHRIKNNLQVISSLLSLQSEKFDDKEVYEAFKDTQNRVVSMSLVHQKLYQTKDLESINLSDYVNDLANHLKGLYNGKYINLNIDVQNIHFELDTIIPLGMLINELVSNSLKYAFSENEPGEITIKLNQNEEGNYTLIIADNGKGISENIDINETDSLGLQLVNSLIDQINGGFELDTSNGTKFIIVFYNAS